jgi:hypothetical protein
MLLKDTFTTQYFSSEIKVPETPTEENQLPSSEDEGKKALLLDQIKKLYLAMKELNQRLQKCLQESGLESHQ